MLKVIQSLPVWLPQTQTWIYNQAKYLPEYIESHIVCGQTENLDQFLLPNIHDIPENSLLNRYSCSHFNAARQRSRLIWLWRNCLRLKPELIHSHFGTTAWDDSLIVRLTNARHIVTFYGFDVSMIPQQNPSWRDRYKVLFQSADLFLCEGPHMAGCIEAIGCPQEKIRVHHLGVDFDRLPFKPRLWHPDEPLRILIAATFKEKKGIPYALDAIGRLNDKMRIEVTIIGDATTEVRAIEEKRRIHHMIEKYNLHSRIQLLGFQPYSVLMEQAYKHHIFLSPSVSAEDGDTEGGAPVTIIEMAATGMPVVSTRHCDIPGVIIHDVTGFLAEERDVDEIYKHLIQLADHPDKWQPMLEKGRAHLETRFDAKKQGLQLAEHYQKAVKN